MSVNKVIILGRVGVDPEVKYMPNGTAVAQLSLATNRKAKNKESGELQDQTEWHRVIFYDKRAEVIGQYVKKDKSFMRKVDYKHVNGKIKMEMINIRLK